MLPRQLKSSLRADLRRGFEPRPFKTEPRAEFLSDRHLPKTN